MEGSNSFASAVAFAAGLRATASGAEPLRSEARNFFRAVEMLRSSFSIRKTSQSPRGCARAQERKSVGRRKLLSSPLGSPYTGFARFRYPYRRQATKPAYAHQRSRTGHATPRRSLLHRRAGFPQAPAPHIYPISSHIIIYGCRTAQATLPRGGCLYRFVFLFFFF